MGRGANEEWLPHYHDLRGERGHCATASLGEGESSTVSATVPIVIGVPCTGDDGGDSAMPREVVDVGSHNNA